MAKRLENYQGIARVYDKLMNNDNYLRWDRLIGYIIKKYKIKRGVCLDVACGTGNMSKLLSKKGFKVIGLDKSAEMIKEAKKKMPKARFIGADVRNFIIKDNQEITIAVSFYDSLNYLLSVKDLGRALENIGVNIPRGAIFIFDLNSKEKIKVAQKYQPHICEGKDFYSVFRYGGRGKIWTINIDCFIKDGKKFEWLREFHKERGYSEKEVTSLLKQAKFDLLEKRRETRKGDDGKPYFARLYFIARKG